jgi:enoyl-CoA hydratase/carnithine racemase
MVSLTKEDEVFVLDLGADDSFLTHETMTAISDALDSVAESSGAAALLTVASGNVWTTGFDLEWISARSSDDEEVQEIIRSLERVITRLLRLPVISVAAIQGHCFAGGAIFAMAHDVRMMRTDRGYFCLPEVNLSVPFSDSLATLLQTKLPAATSFEAMLTGRRYGGIQALAAGIVDEALPLEELRSSAFNRAQSLAPLAGRSMQRIRMQMCRQALDLLES